MSEQSKAVNSFFRIALREDVDGLVSQLVLTERQSKIFQMKYIQGHDVNFIADTIGSSPYSIDKELRKIRTKIAKALDI